MDAGPISWNPGLECLIVPEMLPWNRPIYDNKLPPPCRYAHMRISEYAIVSTPIYRSYLDYVEDGLIAFNNSPRELPTLIDREASLCL